MRQPLLDRLWIAFLNNNADVAPNPSFLGYMNLNDLSGGTRTFTKVCDLDSPAIDMSIDQLRRRAYLLLSNCDIVPLNTSGIAQIACYWQRLRRKQDMAHQARFPEKVRRYSPSLEDIAHHPRI
jgi:hypothetical protein